MSIFLLNCTETIANLNTSTVATPTTSAPDNYAVTDGTYALLNQMISNLSSIKASIKDIICFIVFISSSVAV